MKPASIFSARLGLAVAVLAIAFVRFELGCRAAGGADQRPLRPPAHRAMNFSTHIGMYQDLANDTMIKW